MTTPKSTNQNSQQEAGHDRPADLAGNYGGGSLAGNEALPGEAPRDSMNFSQPAHSLQSDQMGGERAGRGASLQRGPNEADRDSGGYEPGPPGNVGAGDVYRGDTSMQPQRDAGMAQQAGAPSGDERSPGWGNTGDAEGGAPLASRNPAPANRIDQRPGRDDGGSPLLRGSQGSQQSSWSGERDESLIRRGNGSASRQGARGGSHDGGNLQGGQPRKDRGRR